MAAEETKQTPERLEALRASLVKCQQAKVSSLTPVKRRLFLAGFCLAKWDDDIIYQLCYTYGRDMVTEITEFLNKHDNG